MLIKEYRIPLPLSVEEYRIAQLYMIAVSINGFLLREQVERDRGKQGGVRSTGRSQVWYFRRLGSQ